MRIIKRGALERFWRIHPDSKASLESWYSVVRAASWKTPVEMKQVYHNADVVGRRTVFNIAGNKYRLIARVNYRSQRVLFCSCLPTRSMTEGFGDHEHETG